MLPHRTDKVVPVGIVVQVLDAEDVILECLSLLLVEEVVLDIGLDAQACHERVVLLAAVAGIGADFLGKVSVSLMEGAEERYHGKRVGAAVVEAIVDDELVLRRYLQVVAGFGLPVVHGILLHAHEGRVRVGLAVGVAPAERLKTVVILREQHPYLLHQLGAVPLHRLAPYEGVLVRLRLYLRAVYILHVQRDQPLGTKKEDELGEDVVYLVLHAVAETVDGDEVRLLVARQPDEVHVTLQGLLYLAAGIDVVHVGIDDNLQEHLGIVRAAATFLAQLAERGEVEVLNDVADQAHGVVLRNILVYSLRKKYRLVW